MYHPQSHIPCPKVNIPGWFLHHLYVDELKRLLEEPEDAKMNEFCKVELKNRVWFRGT